MNKKILLEMCGIIIVIAIVVIAFTYDQNPAHKNSELEKTIYSIVIDEKNNGFNLNPLTDFNWDKAKLFGPYTPQEVIEEHLGVRYGQTGGIEDRDDIFLLVFLDDENVVQYALLDRQNGVDFQQEKAFITPVDDFIKIKRY
jgi:hypothetical protein